MRAGACGNSAPIILVRQGAQTSDVAALESAVGLLAQRSARTSQAAVVAQQLGKVCMVAYVSLRVDLTGRTVRLSEVVLDEGGVITIDGNDGQVYRGAVTARSWCLMRCWLNACTHCDGSKATAHHQKHGK